MNIKVELDKFASIIDREFENISNKDKCYQEKIYEAMDYSIFTGGKRLRPIMNLKSCELFSGNYVHSIPYALAIEMIHTYSLIHDDLPSMDDDDIRRGKATSHKLYGEAMAILAGDGLLNLAFETVLESIYSKANAENGVKKYIRALNEIACYSGTRGMIGGQVVDLLADGEDMNGDKIIFMYETKTAALIQAALVSGAIIGDAEDEEIEIMREFGYNLGLAYQIRDDILDFEEDSAIGKLTFLTYYDLDTSKEKVDEYSQRAIDLLDQLEDKDTSFFKALTEKLVLRNK